MKQPRDAYRAYRAKAADYAGKAHLSRRRMRQPLDPDVDPSSIPLERLNVANPQLFKADRLARLQALQDELTRASQARLLGLEREVLVEGRSKRNPEELCGRLRTNQIVNFIGPRELVGQLARVTITEAHPHSLKGRWVQHSSTS